MSSATNRLPLAQAQEIAVGVLEQLEPHCEVISIAGSIRRERPTIGDIEIVCVPNRNAIESLPLFAGGFPAVVQQWPGIKGSPDGRYTQRLLPCGLKLDLFMPHPDAYGLILAIRTGSAEWCKQVLAPAWDRAGYRSEDGLLCQVVDEDFPDNWNTTVPCRTERELFDVIGLRWVAPRDREVQP
jgi:DNA polymerase/3'-5' exonuclease PolX